MLKAQVLFCPATDANLERSSYNEYAAGYQLNAWTAGDYVLRSVFLERSTEHGNVTNTFIHR